MELLYLSHCVPGPPDKGERIRAFHQAAHLAARHRLHLVCFARDPVEQQAARELSSRCASLYAEPLSSKAALARAALRFAFGGCLTTSFYGSREMRRYIGALARQVRLSATVAYSSAMAPYAPPGVPLLLDMVDVDSEKWFEYARTRWFGFAYGLEGIRLRRLERKFGQRAMCVFLTTRQEARILQAMAPGVAVRVMECGIDAACFDPSAAPELPQLRNRRYAVFTGVMDYYPNSDGAAWFATRIFPELKHVCPAAEFLIVGRNPDRRVSRLASIPGVTVTGTVPDVRPYLAAASAVVTPLRIARGIQNKVLEALAMGKRVFASTAVADTFGDQPPAGLERCDTERAFISGLAGALASGETFDPRIREAAAQRFCWDRSLAIVDSYLHAIANPALVGDK